MKKRILLLGASGSIGEQTIDIIDKYPDSFVLTAFSVGNKSELIPNILKNHHDVTMVYLIDKAKSKELAKSYPHIKFFYGKKGLAKLVKLAQYDMAVDALVGFVGLAPAINVLKRDKILALANKEALVVGGKIINKLLADGHGKLYPIDSEHVAIAKCLAKVNKEDIDKILITASGGALRKLNNDELKNVKASDALNHPTWKMGAKITIDSATMMNKGFEVIEAYYLFGYGNEKIEILMHDESLVHSAIKLKDGTYILDYGKPDMHKPIEYALFEGKNDYSLLRVKSLDELKDCHFHNYDSLRYPLTELAKSLLNDLDVAKLTALNASNEVAVYRFLNDDVSYLKLIEIVKDVVSRTKSNYNPSFRKIKAIDRLSRKEAARL